MDKNEMVKKLGWAYNYLSEHGDIENAKPLIEEVSRAVNEKRGWLSGDWLHGYAAGLRRAEGLARREIYTSPQNAANNILALLSMEADDA